MQHDTIISALGGASAIERFLGIKERSATHWRRRGIPPRYWPRLTKMPAPESGKCFPIEAFDTSDAEQAAA